MARPDIGLISCPVCGKSGAHVRETERGRAYILCDECNVQIFSRGVESDKIIKANIESTIESKIESTAEKRGEPEKKPVTVVMPEPSTDAGEKTIFDYLLQGVKK